MNYIELNILLSPFQPWNEILVSALAELGFESFTETDGAIQAYISESDFDETKIFNALETYRPSLNQLEISVNTITAQNWNSVWESDFKPVEIGNELLIRAPFHPSSSKHALEVIIQPQMSFGTGHHQTTWLLSKALLSQEFKNKKVLDVGTGTGVLAILAEKLGATQIIGTDIEEMICENATDNCKLNNCQHIDIVRGDIDSVTSTDFDVLIANINKNVLLRHLPHYSKLSAKNSSLYLSGFFTTDVEELEKAARAAGYSVVETYQKDNWAVIKLIKL